ncbi:MAG: chemotaxis protein CheA [Acidobacteria bacterium]|nr:MAG: chemotaxis protein CheA [Acidobacteriota bacterium]
MFPDERQSELKELFFETAAELLQALNEEGLSLEKRPADAELKLLQTLVYQECGMHFDERRIHFLQDRLQRRLRACSLDSFYSYYRLLTSREGKAELGSLLEKPKNIVPYKLSGRFAWTEYEHIAIERAHSQGQTVYHIALAVDPTCPMKSAAMQLVKNVLAQLGDILAAFPDSSIPPEHIDVMEFAVASEQSEDVFTTKCRIPSIISDVLVEAASAQSPIEQAAAVPVHDESADVLGIADANAESTESSTAATAQSTSVKLRVDAERIDTVLNLVGELVIGKSMLMQNISEFDKRFKKDPLRTKFADALAFQARVLNDLQKSVMKIRMVPVEQLFRRFPRIVRDVARTCGKNVVLQVSGEETDLDKSILDTLAEPLSHLVRNSADHGIETPEQRVALGKAPQGTIRLNAFHQGNQIVIQCSDDGAGIDRYKLVSKAVEKGIITHDEAERISDNEALHLIFHPGLSTADEVTAISGRGVGMDIVKSVIEQLKGTISIDSKPGAGTTFLLKVPLTLAIIKALMFRVSDRLYAVPLASVLEIARASASDVHRVDQHEVMQLRDQVLTLIRMGQLVHRGPLPVNNKIFVVVVTIAERKFGLIVDRLVGEEELVIKALDDHIAATEFVSGASILGDGSVVLILNLAAVVARLGKAPALVEAVTA